MEHRAQQEVKALPVRKALLVLRALQAHKEILVRKVLRERQVLKVPKATLVASHLNMCSIPTPPILTLVWES